MIVTREISRKIRPTVRGSPTAALIWSFRPGSPRASLMLSTTESRSPTNASVYPQAIVSE
jgi:hypothetical protein